ncbi:MAG: hypothetical protein C0483_08450 [Pirellula sp.]|nr:hypothetical protein [Pirellula sp.]
MNVRFACLRWTAALLLPALTLAGTPMLRAAEEKVAEKTEAKAEAKPAAKEAAAEGAKKDADRRGPLPFYYGKVVAPDQKAKIYEVQEKFAAEIEPLAAKIKELQAERDKAIEAVLTADQLAKIKELKAEAAAKAAAGRKPAAKKAAAEPKAEKTAAGN